jgi:CCR4-NOT transcription complex subunit 7/8
MASFIRDVWADNVDAEFVTIRDAIVNYPYVAMDTEFPGVVARPIGSFKSSSDFHYQTLRCNVDLLKIIQIGLTLCNEEGQLAPGVCTFQFNFKFSLSDDMYSQDSINLLERSGLNFAEHEERGIDPIYFAELLISSGIVLCDDVKWISFHSGYDFGYLLKVLTCKALPEDEDNFFAQLKLYFPQIYDIKFLMKSCENLKGGLNKLAEDLEVERIGPEHNAGSDSLLTQATFFKMRQLFFENELDDAKYLNSIHGLGKAYDAM